MNLQNYHQTSYQGDKTLKQAGNGAVGGNSCRRYIVGETNNGIICFHGFFSVQKLLKAPVPETAFGLLLNDHNQISGNAENCKIN